MTTMKILAYIPVEKVRLSECTFTYRVELREVDVTRIVRWAGENNRRLGRFHYQADIKRHPDMCAEAICSGPYGAFRVNVQRKGLNPKWKPPVFPAGCDSVEIES